MNGCPDPSHSTTKSRRECARDSVADVDPMRIKVRIDEHSDTPLEHWQDRLKRQRRKQRPRPEPPESPTTPGRPRPDSLIDDYAAPV